jgi:hypothetical protein
VLWGWKTIETRTHSRFAKLAGRRIGIHAGKHFDDGAINAAGTWLTPQQIATTLHYPHQRGAIICTALVLSHGIVKRSDEQFALIECNTVRYGLFLQALEILNPPIPANGRQGIWKFPIKEIR